MRIDRCHASRLTVEAAGLSFLRERRRAYIVEAELFDRDRDEAGESAQGRAPQRAHELAHTLGQLSSAQPLFQQELPRKQINFFFLLAQIKKKKINDKN